MNVSFTVDLRVSERDLLLAHARELVDFGIESTEDAVRYGVVNAGEPPLEHGYEILSRKAVHLSDDRYRLQVTCNILDQEKVIAESRARYVECWQDDDWHPENVEDALYEILVASNPNPSPLDIGFEIWEHAKVELQLPGVSNVEDTPVTSSP